MSSWFIIYFLYWVPAFRIGLMEHLLILTTEPNEKTKTLNMAIFHGTGAFDHLMIILSLIFVSRVTVLHSLDTTFNIIQGVWQKPVITIWNWLI